MSLPSDLDVAVKDFQQKFKEKTGNNWDDRTTFKAMSGKYILYDPELEAAAPAAEVCWPIEAKTILWILTDWPLGDLRDIFR